MPDTAMKLLCMALDNMSGFLHCEKVSAYSVACDGGDEKLSAVELIDIRVGLPVKGDIVELHILNMRMEESHTGKNS